MTEQPKFGPQNIGQGPEGYPPVLRATEKPVEEAPLNTGTLPDAWDNGTASDVNRAAQGSLPGDGIEIKPAGTVQVPELKPGDIGYTENTGNDSVLTDEYK